MRVVSQTTVLVLAVLAAVSLPDGVSARPSRSRNRGLTCDAAYFPRFESTPMDRRGLTLELRCWSARCPLPPTIRYTIDVRLWAGEAETAGADLKFMYLDGDDEDRARFTECMGGERRLWAAQDAWSEENQERLKGHIEAMWQEGSFDGLLNSSDLYSTARGVAGLRDPNYTPKAKIVAIDHSDTTFLEPASTTVHCWPVSNALLLVHELLAGRGGWPTTTVRVGGDQPDLLLRPGRDLVGLASVAPDARGTFALQIVRDAYHSPRDVFSDQERDAIVDALDGGIERKELHLETLEDGWALPTMADGSFLPIALTERMPDGSQVTTSYAWIFKATGKHSGSLTDRYEIREELLGTRR